MNEYEKTDSLEWQVADQSERRIEQFIKSDQSGFLRSSGGRKKPRKQKRPCRPFLPPSPLYYRAPFDPFLSLLRPATQANMEEVVKKSCAPLLHPFPLFIAQCLIEYFRLSSFMLEIGSGYCLFKHAVSQIFV